MHPIQFQYGDKVIYDPPYFVGNSIWRRNIGNEYVVLEDDEYPSPHACTSVTTEDWMGFHIDEIPVIHKYLISRLAFKFTGENYFGKAEPSWEV